MKALSLLILVSLLVAAAAECPFSEGGANAPPPKGDKPPKKDKPPKDHGAPPPSDSGAPAAPPTTSESPAAAPASAPTLAPASEPSLAPAPSRNKTAGNLSPDYYTNICPNLESLVQGAVRGMMASSQIAAAATLRLFFHDCFVTGCDASIMITNPNNDDERHNAENQFLRVDGYNTIIQAKAAVDADPQC